MDERALRTAYRRAQAAERRAVALRAKLREAQAEHRADRDELGRLVLEARAAGTTHVAIAEALGITPQGAKAIADRARRGGSSSVERGKPRPELD